MKIQQTARGFAFADFADSNGMRCSIQDSSSSESRLWLGVEELLDGTENARMHLTQGQVASLIPLLQQFVKSGSISPDSDSPPESTDWRQIAIDLDNDNARLAAEVKRLQAEIDTLRNVLKSSAGHTHTEEQPMKQVYWHEWRTNGESQMIQDFNIQPDALAPYDVLLASYQDENYSGTAFVLLHEKATGALYEVNGSHCSCNGLEDQWQPERTTPAALKMRGWYDVWGGSMAALIELVLDELEKSQD